MKLRKFFAFLIKFSLGFLVVAICATITAAALAGIGWMLSGTFDIATPINWFLGVLVGVTVPLFVLFPRIALVRGLFWQIVGLLSGTLLVTVIRALMGLDATGRYLFT